MIVLDASAWVDVLVGGATPPEGLAGCAVPGHFDAEVVGTLRALVQRGAITGVQGDAAVDRHLRARFRRDFDPVDARTAWQWREAMSITDGWYAALALRHDATWVTSDRRAARVAVPPRS